MSSRDTTRDATRDPARHSTRTPLRLGEGRRYAPRGRQVLALGSLAATATLAGCGEPAPENRLFTSVENCLSAGFSEAVCEGEYQTALQRHLAEAPRFDGQAACEAEFGTDRCTEVPAGSGGAAAGSSQSFFVPFLTGYLVSSALSRVGSYGAYNTFLRSNPSYRPDPIYRSRSGTPVTVGRDASNRPVTRPLNQNTRTVARRGFGGRGFGRGFGG